MPIAPTPPTEEYVVNLRELAQLLEWAKKQGIIKEVR